MLAPVEPRIVVSSKTLVTTTSKELVWSTCLPPLLRKARSATSPDSCAPSRSRVRIRRVARRTRRLTGRRRRSEAGGGPGSRRVNLIAAHQPTGSGGYTLHEAALVSEFMNLAPVLQRVADMAEKATDIEQAEGPDRELTALAWANHVVAFARYIRDESRRPTGLMAVGPVGYGSRQWERIVDHRHGQLAGQTTSKPLNTALHFSAKD